MIVTIRKGELREVDEKILLIAIIGTLEALKEDAIAIEETEKFLFSPYMVNLLREKTCDEKIVSVIEKGCEIEDIYSLLPKKLAGIIDELKQEAITLLKERGKYSQEFWWEWNNGFSE